MMDGGRFNESGEDYRFSLSPAVAVYTSDNAPLSLSARLYPLKGSRRGFGL